MRTYSSLAWMALCATVLLATSGLALAACPHCQNDCCDKEVIEYRCVTKEVKTPIKKVVYECKQVPFCVHKVPPLGHHGCACHECEACPRYKTVLIKKEIVVGEKCEIKCVVEAIPKVPCKHCQGDSPIQKTAGLDEAPLPVDVAPVVR